MSKPKTLTPLMEPDEACFLLRHLDQRRSSAFFEWLLPLWLADEKRLQNTSVAELVQRYDQERRLRDLQVQAAHC